MVTLMIYSDLSSDVFEITLKSHVFVLQCVFTSENSDSSVKLGIKPLLETTHLILNAILFRRF